MNKSLDLLLVNPGARAQVYGKLGDSLSGIEPPLWCALLAAYIRERGYSVKILDAEAENLSPEASAEIVAELNPSIAGIIVLGSNPSASSTPKMTAAGKILRAIKSNAPDVRTIIGGLHPSAIPEQTLQEEAADFVCRGEGFSTLHKVMEYLKSGEKVNIGNIPGLFYRKNGKIFSNPLASLVSPDDLPMAAWDLLPMDKYRAHNWHCFQHIDRRQPYAIIYTSLGCPFNCTYCNIHAFYNDKPGLRLRKPENVVAEIDYLVRNYGVKNIKFLDELFAVNEERVTSICDLLIARDYDLNIWAYARIDTVNERMLDKMKKAGINWLAYGFESASEKVRRDVAKKTGEDITKKAIEMTRAAGIYIMANFIFGLPEDNLETMQATLDMAKEYNFEYVNFYVAMAYPGSQLYKDAIKRGMKLPQQWYEYGQYSEGTLPLPTKYLSPAEVLRFRDNAFREYISRPEYLAMIEGKFGKEVVVHLKDMVKYNIRRKFSS